MTAWTPDEIERRKQVETGQTVVAHMRRDKRLIAWAKEIGLYTRIDRRTEWGNIYVIGEDGTRDEVCDNFRGYVVSNPELMAKIETLRGKVLACHCYPERCHGNELITFIAESPHPSEPECRR
jgi:hypothetical protein